MIDSELKELRMAVRMQEQLVEKLRRVIHDLTDVAGDECGDPDCPICQPHKPKLQVIDGGRDE